MRPLPIIIYALFSFFSLSFMPVAVALSPEEQLDNPYQEQRARALSQQLRCLVCDNQSIDDSDAELARDLRRIVREEILAGKTDESILADLHARYGAYILLRPPLAKSTYLLWFAPIFIVLIGIGLIWFSRINKPPTASRPKIEHNAEHKADHKQPLDIEKPAVIHIILLVAVIIISGVGLYSQLGRPDLAGKPLAARGEEKQLFMRWQQQQLDQQNLHLKQAQQAAIDAPQSVQAQLNLAMAAALAGQNQQEIIALKTALNLTNQNLSIKAMLAEALTRQADGIITLPARQMITEILATDPLEPRALFIAGLAAYQDRHYQQAIEIWTALRDISAPDAPWLEQLNENIKLAIKANP